MRSRTIARLFGTVPRVAAIPCSHTQEPFRLTQSPILAVQGARNGLSKSIRIGPHGPSGATRENGMRSGIGESDMPRCRAEGQVTTDDVHDAGSRDPDDRPRRLFLVLSAITRRQQTQRHSPPYSPHSPSAAPAMSPMTTPTTRFALLCSLRLRRPSRRRQTVHWPVYSRARWWQRTRSSARPTARFRDPDEACSRQA